MQSTNVSDNDRSSFIRRIILRVLVMSVGITFTILGLLGGGFRDVMVKAIRICLECIGIG